MHHLDNKNNTSATENYLFLGLENLNARTTP